MFLCSLIEELCTKEENDKTGCNFNFGHECIIDSFFSQKYFKQYNFIFMQIKVKVDIKCIIYFY